MEIKEGKISSVAALNNRTDLQFISDSQDVESVHDTVKNSQDYNAFFVKIENGEYTEVWGMVGIIPYLSKMVSKLV